MRPLTIPLTHWMLILLFLACQACSGGGGGEGSDAADTEGSEPEQAVVGMTLVGTAETIGSVYLELELPEGIQLETDSHGELTDRVLFTDLPEAYIESVYLPKSQRNYGMLRMALICARGFSSKKFSTLQSELESGGILPLPEEFVVTKLTVTNLRGVELPGYDVAFSVQRQDSVLGR